MNSDSVQNSDCYRSIASLSKGLYKEKGSRFIALAYPVETTDEVRSIVSAVKKEHFDAHHHCFAYRLGPAGELWRAFDDGEPSSSAGRPIYGQLLSNSLSDILIVVVRHFGGIKLGVPGLINAYRTAAAEAIAGSTIIEKTAAEEFTLHFDYLRMNDVMKVAKEMNIKILGQRFDNDCEMDVRVRLSAVEDFRNNLKYAQICQKV